MKILSRALKATIAILGMHQHWPIECSHNMQRFSAWQKLKESYNISDRRKSLADKKAIQGVYKSYFSIRGHTKAEAWLVLRLFWLEIGTYGHQIHEQPTSAFRAVQRSVKVFVHISSTLTSTPCVEMLQHLGRTSSTAPCIAWSKFRTIQAFIRAYQFFSAFSLRQTAYTINLSKPHGDNCHTFCC